MVEHQMIDTLGRHVLMEFQGCDAAILNDKIRLEALMLLAVEKSGATPVKALLHPFNPQGVSGVILLQESHISIHTWPEQGYAAMDFYTCGDCTPEAGLDTLQHGLSALSVEFMVMQRGVPGAQQIHQLHHQTRNTKDHTLDMRDQA